ncbi:MAG: chemotaxis-specific protein-glutamate methyltransferase CheB [Rhodoferax sp.]|nr:chemotaxis-specific protein-glutamate methyltransferase CheB [Rhodoferax sp.]
MGPIRIVIADDSSFARSLLRSFLEEAPDIEIVGEASNGRMAVEMARELKPSLITMDLEMPVMGGLEAIEEIMCSKAVPILVVSSVADAQNALAAVGRGALEVMRKPDFSPEEAAEFVAKVRMLAGVMVITRMRPRTAAPLQHTPAPAAPPPLSGNASQYPRLFAIACSTGGPQALAQILPDLPANFACPIIIAQHISDGFAQGMVDWLAKLCKLPLRLAQDGDLLQGGVVYIAPSERHCSVNPARSISLLERSPGDIFRPSCDVLLNSVAQVFGHRAVGIILTGMSSDGSKGLARIRQQGGQTIAQNEASSVVYGMNRVAIDAGSAQQVLSVEAIAPAMVQWAGTPVRHSPPNAVCA